MSGGNASQGPSSSPPHHPRAGHETNRDIRSGCPCGFRHAPLPSATALDKAFGGGAATWPRMQAAYDMTHALKSGSRIKVRRALDRPIQGARLTATP
jgi:hypothetical protein